MNTKVVMPKFLNADETPPLAHPRLSWSDFKDHAAGKLTVPGLLNAMKTSPDASERKIVKTFLDILGKVLANTTRHEVVNVHWWSYPKVYIDVKDVRYKHYPCGHRMLVSFDVTDGLLYSKQSGNRYGFARKRWGLFIDRLVGERVPRFSECKDREKTTHC